MQATIVTSPTPRRRRFLGRPPNRVEAVGEDVLALIELAKGREPHIFAQALSRKMNKFLDDELETLATWVLSEADFDINVPEVMGPLKKAQPNTALLALVSRMRRRFAKALRDHQRSEADDFYDDCVVE